MQKLRRDDLQGKTRLETKRGWNCLEMWSPDKSDGWAPKSRGFLEFCEYFRILDAANLPVRFPGVIVSDDNRDDDYSDDNWDDDFLRRNVFVRKMHISVVRTSVLTTSDLFFLVSQFVPVRECDRNVARGRPGNESEFGASGNSEWPFVVEWQLLTVNNQ